MLGPLALAPSRMIEFPIDSPNESTFRGTIREDTRIIRCTESDHDMCKNEKNEVNSLNSEDTQSQLEKVSLMEVSPSAECISSRTNDVESKAEGDTTEISQISSDPDVSPSPSTAQPLETKRACGNPVTWRSALRTEDARTSILNPLTPSFVPKCTPVDVPKPDGFNLLYLDRQNILPDRWHWWQNCL